MHLSAEGISLATALAVTPWHIYRANPTRRARIAAGALGVALVFAAFVTELQTLATHTFLWAHLLQNVVLAEWAPALLVLAVPPEKARRIKIPMIAALAAWLLVY